MKVLQINAVYEKFSTGRTTKEMHEYLKLNGHDSYVAAPDLSGLEENAYKIGDKTDWKVHAALSRIFGLQGYFSKSATKDLIRFIDKIKPDIIHLRNLHSNYINLPMLLDYIGENDISTVLTLHDSWFYTGKCVYYIECGCDKWKRECGSCPALKDGNPSIFFDRSHKMLLDKKRLFGKIKHLAVIGVSKWVTEDAKESIIGNAEVVECIYNWIDLEKFAPCPTDLLSKEMGLEGKFVILGIAMDWIPQKGIHIFEELANLLSNEYQIVLVGNTSHVENKSDKIIYLGTVKDVDKLVQLYSLADVFVNPTIQETFGKTTAEAMACGTPVIAYNGTATPELVGIDGTCGFLIDNNIAEEYSKKIIGLTKARLEEMGKNARIRAANLFSKDTNMEEYMKVYHSLLLRNSQ